jgi:hypothetical protein
MTTERDPGTRIVLSWLREDAHENAERVLLRALDEVDTTPQRRSWWPAWRTSRMNTYAKLIAATAAVLVVAIGGYQLLPGGSDTGTPTAPPATPTVTSVPTEVPRLPEDGPIEAGTYRMDYGPTLLVTVPPGWVSYGTSLSNRLEGTNSGVGLDLFFGQIQVFADACQSEGTEQPIGPTAGDLIAALQAQESSDISEPVTVTVAGVPGSRFQISAPSNFDGARCSNGDLQIWLANEGVVLTGVGGATPATVYVADTPGGRLLFMPYEFDPTAADIAERDAIIDSIQIVE